MKEKRPDPISQMRAADPVSELELRASIGDGEASHAMHRAIAIGDAAPPFAGVATGRRRLRYGLATGLACVTALVALVLAGGGSVGGGGGPAFAAAAVEVAEANPRLLVTLPGWEVTDAGEFEADAGEVTFGDGTHRFEIHWYPADLYGSYLHDRALVSTPETSTLLGLTATTVRYGEGEYATMLSPQGSVFVEARGRLDGRAGYEAVLHSLRRVDVDAWLAAMPPNVVRPDARGVVVERWLRGVPLPPGFDRGALTDEGSVLNHYQLAVAVAGAVSCGWVESWLAAAESGDRAGTREAVEAMATSEGWPMMPTLVQGGGWSGNVQHAARAIASGHLDRGPAGTLVRPDGSGYELGPAWAVGLNCTSRYWRRPLER